MSVVAGSFFSSDNLPLPMRRFTVEEYHQLGESGVLKPEDRVELLEGWIVEKMNHRPAHGFAVTVLTEWFVKQVPTSFFCRCLLPVTLASSEPEPDLAIVSGNSNDYRLRHPGGKDCRLVIEVAESSMARDRAKSFIYAAAGIPEYWIIHLIEKSIEQLSQPQSNGYQKTRTYSADEAIEIGFGNDLLAFPTKLVLG